jgi:THO complex subunit 1
VFILTSFQINSKNKDLVILRLCNELLRRLSRAEDPVFCGRVYIFMFQSFPLGDKSSVNLRGNFHVENVTTFEDFLQEENADEDSMQIDTDGSAPATKEDTKSDKAAAQVQDSNNSKDAQPTTLDTEALYPVFWSLQQSFSNPPRLFEEDNFKQFQTSLEATLAKFKQVPLVIQAADAEGKKGQQSEEGNDHDAFASSFNPKYLTSRDLFKLEVRRIATVTLALMTDQFPAERSRLSTPHPCPSTDTHRLPLNPNREVEEQAILPECAESDAIQFHTS